jgi:hypothetical protein
MAILGGACARGGRNGREGKFYMVKGEAKAVYRGVEVEGRDTKVPARARMAAVRSGGRLGIDAFRAQRVETARCHALWGKWRVHAKKIGSRSARNPRGFGGD